MISRHSPDQPDHG